MGHNDLNRSFLFLGNGLRFDTCFDFAVDEVLNKCADIVMGDLLRLIVRELLVLDGLLDGKGRPLALFQVQVPGVGTEGFGVDSGEVECTLVSLREWLQSLCELFALFRCLGENVGERNFGLYISVSSLIINRLGSHTAM